MTPAVTLDTHIQDIINVIRWEELSGIVLCGHSYGGMVVTGVADKIPDQIRSLVYLDAFVPANGDTLMDYLDADMQAAMRDDARIHGEGYLTSPIPSEIFKVNQSNAAFVDRMSVKHPLACFEQKSVLTGALARVPRHTYVLATQWGPPQPFVAIADRLRQDPTWKVMDLPSGHDVMVDMPKETAEILIAASV
jgi:pimeloyl-ACP methyl ester carboxylesterase